VVLVITDVAEDVQLLDAANVVPCSPFLVTLMMEAIGTTAIRHNIPEDGILYV
jgi:hypothetical protein